MKRKPSRARIDEAALAAMVEEATVDSGDESNIPTEQLELPFETSVVGIVTVQRLEATVRNQIVEICARAGAR